MRVRAGARSRGNPQPRDRGAVTVEAAIAVGTLTAVLALALAGVAAVTAQLQCVDAAREAARLFARGENDRATRVLDKIGPSGAQLSTQLEGDAVRVEVTLVPASGLLPGLRLRGTAYAVVEKLPEGPP